MGNLPLPGNPRYQPKDLQSVFGYDNLFRAVAEVEIATLKTLADIGIIPAANIASLTPDVEQELLAISTTEVDDVERTVTRHDIRAWVRIAQSKVDPGLRRWIHVPLTSYDALDTARALQFVRGHDVVRRLTDKVVDLFVEQVDLFALSAPDRANARTARAAHHRRLLVRNDPQPDPHQHPECQQCRGKAGGKDLRRCRRLQRSSGSRHRGPLR